MGQSNDQSGVTLLELVVVLGLFSLIATLTFQGLSDTISNRAAVQKEVETQSKMAYAHRALSSAVESMASLKGNQNQLTFYLNSADSGYYPQANTQSFIIQNRSIKFILDSSISETSLIDDFDSASFYFVKNGERLSDWRKSEKPDLLGLEWTIQGKSHTWLFSFQ